MLAVFSSCSSDSKSKMISPTSTDFTSGELSKLIKVEDAPAELTYSEKDGAIPTQYMRLKVKLTLKEDGNKGFKPDNLDFTGLLGVATINIVDKNGITLVDLSVKNEELPKLKKLLTGNAGDSEEIIFEGSFNNREDAPKWYEQAAEFTPYLTANISMGSESMESSSSELTETVDDGGWSISTDSSAGSEDWDDVLDSYDSYVSKYISLAKKAANGDMDAMSEYTELMEKAEELSNKLSNAQSEMSAAQWKRYMNITQKMANI